jgi:hypothetical protein
VAALAILGRFGREVGRLGQDRFQRTLPARLDDIDAARLSGWLGATVTSVRRIDATSGTTDRARFALEGPDVPASVFVKIPAGAPVIRLFGYLAGLGENEVRFYRQIRPRLDVNAPVLLGSAFDARTKRFALVLDDLAAAGATFSDSASSLDPAQSLLVLENLARLHGRYWSSPDLDRELAWIIPNRDDLLLPAIHRSLTAMAKRIAGKDPDLISDDGRAILAAYPDVVRQMDRGPHTVLHGDPHPGNCYFLGGRAGLFDWQVLRRGHPLRDVTYHLVLAFDRDTRKAVEHDLLHRYCEALAANGGPEIDDDTAWRAYRKMVAAPYVAAVFTVGLAGLQPDDIARSGLVRSAAAVADLGTAAALELEPLANPPRTRWALRRTT